MSTVQEQETHNVSSVYSILHDIQSTLSHRFPNPTAPHLHPYIRNTSHPASGPWATEREKLLGGVKELRRGVEGFRKIWKGQSGEGESAEGSEMEQKKTVLLRIMQDWYTNQHALLSVSSLLNSLLAQSQNATHPPTRTPFVQAQTLSSPTNRLVALAQRVNLEVSLDNEDPSFGMGMGEEVVESGGGDGMAGKQARVDTLALAGQRMVIDLEITHPSPSGAVSTGWKVRSLRVERVDPEHLASVGGMDVDLPPVVGEGTGTRCLHAQSRVLEEYLGRYLDAVNAYDESERRWEAGGDETEEGETLELVAERAVLAFGEQLLDLRGIDLKMRPLDGMGTDVDMEAGRAEVVLWDQLDELHALIQSSPGLSITSPAILPTFRPFPDDTFLENPTCRLVLSDSATVRPFSKPALAAWAMEFDEPVLVSDAFFGHGEGKRDHAMPEVTLESLCGVDPSRPSHFRGVSGVQQSFLFPRSRVAGMYVDCIGVRSREDIISTTRAVRRALWIAHLLKSCVNDLDPVAESTGDLDDELDELLTGKPNVLPNLCNAHPRTGIKGTVAKPKNLAVVVGLDDEGLSLLFPLHTPVTTETPVMLILKIQPDGESLAVSLSTDTPLGDGRAVDWVRERLNEEELGRGLVRDEGNVPVWLDKVWAMLYP